MIWNDSLYDRLHAYREARGYPWFTGAFDLNLLVLRSGQVGLWDDLTCWAFLDDAHRKCVELFTATGDAWAGEWTHPTNPHGCAYVTDQHVSGGWQLGVHRAGTKHARPALVQAQPFEFVRWPKSAGRVPTVAELNDLHRQRDVRGFNLHNRVSGNTPLRVATDDSESCTVHLYQHQHAAMLELVNQQSRRGLGSAVSVTFGLRADAGV